MLITDQPEEPGRAQRNFSSQSQVLEYTFHSPGPEPSTQCSEILRVTLSGLTSSKEGEVSVIPGYTRFIKKWNFILSALATKEGDIIYYISLSSDPLCYGC